MEAHDNEDSLCSPCRTLDSGRSRMDNDAHCVENVNVVIHCNHLVPF